MYQQARFLLAGDKAICVELGDAISPEINRRVRNLFLALQMQSITGITDLVPTYRSILVYYDPMRIDHSDLEAKIRALEDHLQDAVVDAPRVVEVPTVYGGDYGPDLEYVASHSGLSTEEVISIHSGTDYLIYMMGFTPGFTYLGGMSKKIATPRLQTPRTAVPAGSVGVAEEQTGVYPIESPGGWRLIGRTPMRLFDPDRDPPVVVETGDYLRFVPVSESEYLDIQRRMRSGSYRIAAHPAGQSIDMIEVIESGIFTTVQDLGRYGYQRYGVPVSGALDQFALRVANLLVGNAEGDAGLEITITGPRVRFLADTMIAVTGGDLGPLLDGQPIPCWQSVTAPRDSVLSFAGPQDGIRAYLTVAGGIDTPEVLGSRSTYARSRLGGLEGRALVPGDRLPVSPRGHRSQLVGRRLPVHNVPAYGSSHALRVLLGPQDDAFTEQGIGTFLSSTYTITPIFDRMGSRLAGPTIEHKRGADIVSDGTPLGAVQVTGEGLPIVLLADRGTTGGYTKIATVISVDLAIMAQAQADDTVTFPAVTLEEAHQALREQERVIKELRGALV